MSKKEEFLKFLNEAIADDASNIKFEISHASRINTNIHCGCGGRWPIIISEVSREPMSMDLSGVAMYSMKGEL